MSRPLMDTNSPEFLERVSDMTKILNATIGRFDENPQVVIPVLMRMLCVEIVSETFHIPWQEVRRNSMKSFRGALSEAHEKMTAVLASESPSND